MRKSTSVGYPDPLEEMPRGVGAGKDAAIIMLRRGSAGNDATCEDPAIQSDDADPWARHALVSNGFGDVATGDTAFSAQPTSDQVFQAARVHRALTVGRIIVAALHAVGAIARRAHARYRRHRQAKAIYDALEQLDDRTLHDLGFERSEIWSVAAEATGEAEYTRAQVFEHVDP